MTKEKHFKIWQKAFKDTFTLNSVLAAAGVAYFAFFSFFPLILLVIAVASRWFDPFWVEHELISQLEFISPGISHFLGENLSQVIQARGSVTTSASLILIWSGSTLFSIVARILDTIWVGDDIRSGIRYRGLALLFVGGLSIVLLPLLFFSSWLTPLLRNVFSDIPAFAFFDIGFLTSALISGVLFASLYHFMPHNSPAWQDVWIGALTSGFLWEGAKRFFVWYSINFLSTSNLVYGSVSTIIAFLAWVHLSGLIFFFGAYIGVGYRNARKSDEESTTL